MFPHDAGSLIPTIATVEPRPHSEFLGEELDAGPRPPDGPWWLRAILSAPPREDLAEDGSIPARRSAVLPLRHGLTATGAPARCLLDEPDQLLRLRAIARTGAVRTPPVVHEARECAACAAWIARLRAQQAPAAAPGPLDYVREVFEKLVA
ncbi:MAG: hypothetical protein QM767_20360 [Anaeromyxobacter sp.]